MFEAAFIQEKGQGRFMPEAQLVHDHCVQRGIPITLYTPKRIDRRQLPLTNRSFIFGDMDCMHGAMRQLKIPIPAANYYPEPLKEHLHRNVWMATLREVRTRVEGGDAPVFAKPASRAKIFTGRVFSDHSDFYEVGQTSLQEPVWCSDIVSWQSEFRVYVIGTDIVSIAPYAGDASIKIDANTVQHAINAFAASGAAPSAYGVDFGVLSSGETALVEANDGYALGAYAIASAPYTELLFTRWRELLTKAE